jgi:DNA-binding NarL/FixJ family response regulator
MCTFSDRQLPHNVIAQTHGLTHHFAGRTALAQVDLEIQAGKVLAILGPNGAGKSTLTNILLGRLTPNSGQVCVFDGQQALQYMLSERGQEIEIVLTAFSISGYLRRAMDAGVKGYLLKDSPCDELIRAIKTVHQGGKAMSPELMVDAWMEQDPLWDKERQALRLAKEGLSTEKIAEQLFLSAGTVRNYLFSASSKLNVTNPIEAARIAHQKGWL